MRSAVLLFAAVGCGAAAPACPVPPRPADADIVRRSHDLLAALDRGDVATVKASLGPSYIHYEGRLVDRDKELEGLAHWADDPASHVASRTWSDEHVFARANDAIFIGKATEHQAGNDVHGGYQFEGWYTLEWSREGGDWKLVYWTWKVAGTAGESAMWNQIFHNAKGFTHDPNKLLVELAATHAPGTAMDVTMGQGRNALYLASKGWTVTGVDISDEGIRQAREAAAASKLTIDAIVGDVTTFDYGVERWDLVAMIYAYPALKRIPDLQRATRRGGLFVYEFFAPVSADDEGPKPGELAKQFAGWDILRDEIVDDVPDWRADRAKIQRFVARKK